MAATNIQILVGSVGGTATQVAMNAAAWLSQHGYQVGINEQVSSADLNGDEVLLLCHSNTGAGELPDNIQPLYLHLVRDYPRIAGRLYGVINLGDSSYTSFNEAGILLDAALADLGAIKLGQSLVFDALDGAPDLSQLHAWLEQFHQLLAGRAS